MNLSYPYLISLRYFKAKKSNRGISVNTAISISGVTLGVMALIIVLSVMSGFQEDVRNKILGMTAHIYLLTYNDNGGIKDYDKIMKKIIDIQQVKGASPFVLGQTMISFKKRTQGAVVRGILPELEIKTTDLLKNLKIGSLEELNEHNQIPGIIVGRELARALGLIPGDTVTMISPMGKIGPLGMLPKIKKCRVSGIFEAGMYEYDSSFVYIHLSKAQQFFDMKDKVTGIEVKVDDIYNANWIARLIEKKLGFPFYTKDWMEMNKPLFSALKLEKIAMFVILVLIIFVAAFNIISNLFMIVAEKAREIAILKAMGAKDRSVMSIFMFYGLIIGLIGTVLGLSGGYVTCYLLKTFKFIPLDPSVYYLSHLPVRMSFADLIYVCTSAILICFTATIYPSWKASRMNPVEPLRYE